MHVAMVPAQGSIRNKRSTIPKKREDVPAGNRHKFLVEKNTNINTGKH
jgi:hypothetical protein